ncbi:NAD(P)/FAD-dependent oxidoreductase [Williamsia sp. CHRR-6]|uniref:NAD(P)/FAD-dependent oxidoreductase n=1 Tax=Williamsia sp. CHRR-6 TaxID=2835871 RepID=UPI001BDAC797|nr:FAD-dependent oxidoreductase [Williamsia sp. CHRR-6]MBT0568193.1 FAD-dependent oxidoreductase [Williamsia sp. CHRR-6]
MTTGSTGGSSPTVAIVGSGVSGLTAAYLLSHTHAVTIFEADDRLGGHAHTHRIPDGDAVVSVDSGFIVHNEKTYPLLRRLFGRLGVPTQPTEMSMSICDEVSGFEYAGGRGMGGILARPVQVLSPRFVGMLLQVKRFHRTAATYLDTAPEDDLTTFAEFLRRNKFGAFFRRHYAIPLVSCVWSSGAQTSLDYPARYLFAFLRNHGMLTVKGSPQWFTVTGGSHTYVDRVAAAIDDIRLSTGVSGILRDDDGVRVTDVHGVTTRFDRVVVATHPDQALALLADPTEAEKSLLSAFTYTPNEAVLHTDSSLLPTNRRARASWNYLTPRADTDQDKPPVVTYWMNRLQSLHSERDYLVTLNARELIDPTSIIAVMDYAHPTYTPESVAAQSRLSELNTETTAFAGAYHGWGFHEDGCRSGAAAAEHFGARW